MAPAGTHSHCTDKRPLHAAAAQQQQLPRGLSCPRPAAVDSTGRRGLGTCVVKLLRTLPDTPTLRAALGTRPTSALCLCLKSSSPCPRGGVRMEGTPNTPWETFIHCVPHSTAPLRAPGPSLWVHSQVPGKWPPPLRLVSGSASCGGQ